MTCARASMIACLLSSLTSACAETTRTDAGIDADGLDAGALDAAVLDAAVLDARDADAALGAPCPAVTLSDGVMCSVVGETLMAPRDVWATSDGTIFATEFSGGRIVRLEGARWVTVLDGLAGPIGLRQESGVSLVFAEEHAHSLARTPVDGAARSLIAGDLRSTTYVALGPDGAAYVSTFATTDPVGSGIVYRVDLSTGVAAPFATGLHVPEGLFVDSRGSLHVVEWQLPSSVFRFPPGGGDVSVAERVATGFDHAYGLCPDGAEGLYVGDHAGRVVHVSAGTERVVVEGIGRPGGISRHPSGDLLVAEFVDFGATGRILRLSGALP